MSRSRPLPVVLAMLALALAACSSSAASPTEAEAPLATASQPDPTESEAAESEAPAESDAAAESEAAAAEDERVRLESSNFDPEELTIAVGTTVRFLNADSFAHTVTEGTGGQAVDDPIVDENLEPTKSVGVTFDEPGTYEITCELHPSMQMTITVEG
jgi:plastocyanin